MDFPGRKCTGKSYFKKSGEEIKSETWVNVRPVATDAVVAFDIVSFA